MESNERVLPSGTKVTCPDCGKHISTTIRDIKTGDVLKSEYFIYHGNPFKPGMKMDCDTCGCQFGRIKPNLGAEIHTSEGWK